MDAGGLDVVDENFDQKYACFQTRRPGPDLLMVIVCLHWGLHLLRASANPKEQFSLDATPLISASAARTDGRKSKAISAGKVHLALL